MASVHKMGFEGLIYYGAVGSTASTQLTNTRDISISTDPEYGDTTVRGAGTSVPINTQMPTSLGWSCDFNMIEKSDDTSLAALKTAVSAGSPIALRMIDYSGGKGFDGDVYLSQKQGKPLKGESTHDFTATPAPLDSSASTRTPSLYV